MKLWIVNPFDPLPGEREQLGRYACLAETAGQAGHEVVWWSSSFSHRFKRDVDQAAVIEAVADQKLDIRLVPTQRYTKNISYRRIRSHRAYARSFRELAGRESPPHVIVVSSPPLETALEAAKMGVEWHVPTIIDIQDQWPDTFARVIPRSVQWLSRPFLKPLYEVEREAYTLASGIVGVAQGYLDRGVEVGGPKQHSAVFPIGVDLDEVGHAVAKGAGQYAQKWRKPDGQVWLLYSGSHTVSYDVLTIVRAAAMAQKHYGDRVQFFLTGSGELIQQESEIIQREGLNNVTLTGFMEFPEWAYLLSQVDVGCNAALPNALIYFPNKIFYYLGAGAAILNTIPGQCEQLVDEEGCGLNYTAGDPESCFRAITRLIEQPGKLAAMRTHSKRLADEVFDRQIIYADYTKFLEQVVASRER